MFLLKVKRIKKIMFMGEFNVEAAATNTKAFKNQCKLKALDKKPRLLKNFQ